MHELHLESKITFFPIEHLDTKDSQEAELKPGQPLVWREFTRSWTVEYLSLPRAKNSPFPTAIQHLCNFSILPAPQLWFWWFNIPERPLVLWRTSSWHCGAGERSYKKCAYDRACMHIIQCVGETCRLCYRFFFLKSCREKVPWLTPPNASVMCCIAPLVCRPLVLSQGIQRFVIRLHCLPFHSTRAVYRNSRHLLLSIIPQDVCLPLVYLCLCNEVKKKTVQRNTEELVQEEKLKVTVKEAREATLK